MQTEREYLASLTPPLAIPGVRGRFSKAAKAELVRARTAGMEFAEKASTKMSTDNSEPFIQSQEPVVYPPIKSKPKIRDIKNVKGHTVEGYLVASDVCFRCCEHVTRCDCKSGIKPSSIVATWADESSRKYGVDLPTTV